MTSKKREKQHVKATGQAFDAPMKVPHLFITFLVPIYIYQPQFPACLLPILEQTSVSEKVEPALSCESSPGDT